MSIAVLLLGSNVGERLKRLEEACLEIDRTLGKIIQRSSVYETAAWGNTDQGSFLNSVVKINSSMEAEHLMESILLIEERMGRVRKEKWEPRVIDIDILFYDDEIISGERLVVPHPGLHLRKFTLMPLAELMPDFIHPVLKKSIADLLQEVNDTLEVKKIVSN